MKWLHSVFVLGLVVGFHLTAASELISQMVATGGPWVGGDSGFTEQFGFFGSSVISDGSGFFFHSGGMPPGPFFGGFDPSSAATFHWSGGRGAWRWSGGFSASQGSSRSMTTQGMSLTLTPGVPGYLFDGSFRPFVTSVIPIVGSEYSLVHPLPDRIDRWRAAGSWEKYQYEKKLTAEKEEVEAIHASRQLPVRRKPDDPPLRLGHHPSKGSP